ncbi:MAG: Type II secretion system protein E [Candidatus Magasanikbacteria bacterium GW2011_GWC2_34_16]|uniref:Type II secretion system protein E n=2 Tax=Candidatus Magasanikiibacteriota TaxID=1752731 RepID=A0A0G0HDB4_9BACT|nr:MAG: Type II secretion system protein E [Candidatus Magasanikbacteria bacterium GW2011_GWC2_34_16]KKQ41148.1 MAG: Type II secretion system protein E [Candidatus Magasanikbacteria bacterium GW2011_GWA2_37_8]
MLPPKILKTLIKEIKVDAKSLRAAQAKALKLKKGLEEVLIMENIIDETGLYEKAAEILKFPFVALKGKEIKKEIINLIPGPVAGTHQVVAFDKDKDTIKLAMTDPTDIQTIEFLRRKTGLEPKVYITAPSDLREALRQYHAQLEDDLQIVQDAGGEVGTGDLKKAAEELPIINIVNSVLEHAVYENASDIHIEPGEKEVTIRYRIDGILKPVMTLPKTIQNGITARIKILSNLKLDEHMVPQDGRFKIQIQEEKLAFRVSLLPVYDGEKIVMRLLHEGAKPLSLDQLGFLDKPRKIVENAIKKPHGMILVTGPTGSGKTTTLYTVLGILNQPGVNISTVEDPIEYRMAGVNQSQINPKAGFTFASGLRALLRQDPNIIMVGEIRDQETAEIAINAAMTGHLVLSTLHTNDAPTTLPRLIDMGVPPFLVAYTANIIVAQRLLRRICPYCKQEFALDKTASDELAKAFDIKKLPALFKEYAGIKEGKDFVFYQGAGCHRCGQTGFKGRQGIYEIMEIDSGLIKKINERANANDIRDYAREHGMLTMLEDGLIKARMGVTTISEVLRVTRE